MEIGNEDQFDRSGSYEGRYAQFYKEIKTALSESATDCHHAGQEREAGCAGRALLYAGRESFADAQHYDKADRNGPKIFVGEWATREGEPTPNLEAALGDAAWMTGMERNSDLIMMASYAPLFVNVNPGGMQWETDLIGYDALSSYGSPSYWAQVIFASHLGTEVVPPALDHAGPKVFASATRDEKQGKVFIKIVNASSRRRGSLFRLMA